MGILALQGGEDVNKNGDRFFARFTEYVTGEHAKHFVLALCEEFDDDLIVVLHQAR